MYSSVGSDKCIYTPVTNTQDKQHSSHSRTSLLPLSIFAHPHFDVSYHGLVLSTSSFIYVECTPGLFFFFKGALSSDAWLSECPGDFCVYSHTGLVLNTCPGKGPEVRPVISLGGGETGLGWSSVRTALFSPPVC